MLLREAKLGVEIRVSISRGQRWENGGIAVPSRLPRSISRLKVTRKDPKTTEGFVWDAPTKTGLSNIPRGWQSATKLPLSPRGCSSSPSSLGNRRVQPTCSRPCISLLLPPNHVQAAIRLIHQSAEEIQAKRTTTQLRQLFPLPWSVQTIYGRRERALFCSEPWLRGR